MSWRRGLGLYARWFQHDGVARQYWRGTGHGDWRLAMRQGESL